MTEQHPITVPTGMITCWKISYRETCQEDFSETKYIATQAAQWGADQELEACCSLLLQEGAWPWPEEVITRLRTARRPKPQTLNSVALQMLGTIERDAHYIPEITDTIRKALEALNDRLKPCRRHD